VHIIALDRGMELNSSQEKIRAFCDAKEDHRLSGSRDFNFKGNL